MKLLSKNAVSTYFLVLCLGLVSCEKSGQMIRPDDGIQIETDRTNDPITVPGGPILIQPKYKLVKYAHWNLSYDANGDLVKMQSTIDPTLIREYIRPSNGSGIVIQEQSGGKLSRKTMILFDAKNRCKESYRTSYGFANGQVTSSTERFNYTYNAKNQLEKVVNQDDNSQYDLFTYNGDGNLVQVKRYDNSYKGSLKFSYSDATTDRNRLNSPFMALYNELDEFLPIYGKLNKHLVSKFENFTAANYLTDQVLYKYKLNNDGYIDEREHTRTAGGQTLKETFVFKYQ